MIREPLTRVHVGTFARKNAKLLRADVRTFPRANVYSPASQPFITPRRALLLIGLLLVSALALLYLWQSWQSVYWLNQVQENRGRLAQLQAERDHLQLEVARAFSLQRIAEVAGKRLGMIHPPLKFLVLPPARVEVLETLLCQRANVPTCQRTP